MILSFLHVSGQGARLIHETITVPAREYRYVEIIDVIKGSTIKIWAYINPVSILYTTVVTSLVPIKSVKASEISSAEAYVMPSEWDIDIAIIRPDGSFELIKNSYSREFRYTFIATISGVYRLWLDNSRSQFTTKYIDLAIVIEPPLNTATVTETQTIIRTDTIVKIETYTMTTPITYTSTLSPDLAMVYQLPSGQLATIISVLIGFIIGLLVAETIKRRYK